MKKIFVLLIICLSFASCHQLKVAQSLEGVSDVIPPGSTDLQKTDKDYWYSFKRNNIKYLVYYYSSGGYGESVIIIEDK